MKIIFVIAAFLVVGSTATDSDYETMLDSDEDSFEDQVDDSDDSGENSSVVISTSSPPITSTPVISSTFGPTKIPLDTSWKKNGIEDMALRAVASLEFDNAETAIMWIKRGANLNGFDKDLETPLHKTAYKDCVNVATVLIQNGADVNAVDKKKRTPLRLAQIQGSKKVAELLIKNGGKETADLSKIPTKRPATTTTTTSKPQSIDEMLLDIAFEAGDDSEQASGLIEIGAKVNTQSSLMLETPLHRTAHKDNVKIAQVLISNGANLNALDTGEKTPLHIAAIFGSLKVAKLLIQKGANVNRGDSLENRPLHDAIKHVNTDIAKLLIENGAYINAVNYFKETPLMIIYMCDDPGFVKYLFQKGADIGARDDQHRNARDLLKMFGNPKTNFEVDRMLEEAEIEQIKRQFG